MNLQSTMKDRASQLAKFLETHFELRDLPHGQKRLLTAARYSLLQEGGKRFRPVLAMLTAEALGWPTDRIMPFAAAVECVHTYSLIHDDLPAMDDDDERRGQPTLHRKFDEATAILAGDGLLIEAFQLVADGYIEEPELALRAVSELARASGFAGMVGGQAADMEAKKEKIKLDELRHMHELKTGALIRVAAVGAGLLCQASAEQLRDLAGYASSLGLAFQVADDILDDIPGDPELGSYPAVLGLAKTRVFLKELTDDALASIEAWPAAAEPLREIARFNLSRSN